MSVLLEFSIFPVDKGVSVSPYVARVLTVIRDSGLPFELGPMGTTIEGEWAEVMGVMTRCFEELRRDSERIYLTAKVDYRRGPSGRLTGKVKSVREKMGS